MELDELAEWLPCLIGKKLENIVVATDPYVLMVTFESGKTLYVSGVNLSIDVEAVN